MSDSPTTEAKKRCASLKAIWTLPQFPFEIWMIVKTPIAPDNSYMFFDHVMSGFWWAWVHPLHLDFANIFMTGVGWIKSQHLQFQGVVSPPQKNWQFSVKIQPTWVWSNPKRFWQLWGPDFVAMKGDVLESHYGWSQLWASKNRKIQEFASEFSMEKGSLYC